MEEKRKRHTIEDSHYKECVSSSKRIRAVDSASSPASSKSSYGRDQPLSMPQKQWLKQYYDMSDDYASDPPSGPEDVTPTTSVTSTPVRGGKSPEPSTPTATSRKLTKRNSHGETLLMVTAKKGDLKALKQLILEGADVNGCDFAGWSTLHECCIRDYPRLAEILLRHGARVNHQGPNGDTALHDAARQGLENVLDVLLKYKADTTIRNERGEMPLDVAADSVRDRLQKVTAAAMGLSTSSEKTISPSSTAKSHSSPGATATSRGRLSKSNELSTPGPSTESSYKDPYAFEEDEDMTVMPVAPPVINSDTVLTTSPLTSSSSTSGDGSHQKVPPLRIRLGSQQAAESTSAATTPEPGSSATLKSGTGPAPESKDTPSPTSHHQVFDEATTTLSHLEVSLVGEDDGDKANLVDSASTGLEFANPDSVASGSSLLMREDDTNSSGATKSTGLRAMKEKKKKKAELSVPSSKESGKKESERSRASSPSVSSTCGRPSGSGKGRKPNSSMDTSSSKQVKRSASRTAASLSGAPATYKSKSNTSGSEETALGTTEELPSVDSPSRRVKMGRTLRSHTAAMREKEVGTTGRKGGPPLKRRKFSRKRHMARVAAAAATAAISASAGGTGSTRDDTSPSGSLLAEGGASGLGPGNLTTASDEEDEEEEDLDTLQDSDIGSVTAMSTSGGGGNATGGSSVMVTVKREEASDDEGTLSTTTVHIVGGANDETEPDSGRPLSQLTSFVTVKTEKANTSSNLLVESACSTGAPGQDTSAGGKLTSGKDSKLLTRMEMPPNPFKKALELRNFKNQIISRLVEVRPKAPNGFEDYLRCTRQYLLVNQNPGHLKKRQVPQDLYSKPELCRLFQEQEADRFSLLLRQQAERDHLRLVAEQEVIRAQSKAALALSLQARPLSACSVLAYKDLTYLTEDMTNNITDNSNSNSRVVSEKDGPMEETATPGGGRFSAGTVIQWIQQLKEKYTNEKKHILCRQLHESEALMMVQKLDWEMKLKELMLTPSLVSIYEGLGSPSSGRGSSIRGSHIPQEHVPSVEVPHDFMLLPHDPLQKAPSS